MSSEAGESETQHPRSGRRSSLERYRPGGRRDEEFHTEEDHPSSSYSGRGRGRGNLAANDLRRKINEARRNQPPVHSVDYINQGNINVHSNYHRSNNHHRSEHRYAYDTQRQDNAPRGNNGQQGRNNNGKNFRGDRKKNTESFEPSYSPPDMRILLAPAGGKEYNREYSTRDVVQVGHLFSAPEELDIYDRLLKEIEDTKLNPDDLWQSWHGDSHLIADDNQPWKEKCPTFSLVIDRIANYFQMDVKATRFNWYRDASEWKPYHHDAAAIKPKIAKKQNFTAGVSFGAERDAAFQHSETRTVISLPQPNGTVYTFGKDVNIMWRHGIPQRSPKEDASADDENGSNNEGRISIILWGWINQVEI
eukprot:TRINITY_DN1873_c1_g1_i1.p1 TRINITY_DN1873_c1_g1~~TRINITY_DN1873_c1_g1_i1.p1  ORF type:complete len:363 (+),score=88.25 TRINITY_DN1873_c1_g1_i1:114-1202(+)